jgi:hypothetical protein
MNLRPGTKLHSAVCETQLIVVRAPSEEAGQLRLTCGGAPLLADGEAPPEGVELDPAQGDGTRIGKRYADEALGLELLCTRSGDGTVACNGVALPLKEAKPLPASD